MIEAIKKDLLIIDPDLPTRQYPAIEVERALIKSHRFLGDKCLWCGAWTHNKALRHPTCQKTLEKCLEANTISARLLK